MSSRYARLATADGTGITRPLSRQVNLLGSLLGQALRDQAGDDALALVERLRLLCRTAAQTGDEGPRDEAAQLLQERSLEELTWLLRAFTAFFHLVNQAEQQEILRVNRARTRRAPSGEAAPAPSRPESIDEAVGRLRAQGYPLEAVCRLATSLDIQPTLTAHPTEARRRSVLYKQQHIAALLRTLQAPDATAAEQEAAGDALYNQIALLLATDEVRPERPTVRSEVENGLYFVRTTLWEVIPRIRQDLARAIERHYGEALDVPPPVRFRSWIGADRDGNPNVTPEVTRETALTQRRTALRLFYRELRALRRELSLSDRQTAVPEALFASLAKDAEELSLPGSWARDFQHEPYRLKVSFMMVRLRQAQAALGRPGAAPYTTAHFLADLDLLDACLRDAGFGSVARHGRLARVRCQARAFGFHLLPLDVRQHSRLHARAVAALLEAAGVCPDYEALDEATRLEVLAAELANPRPLRASHTPLPDDVRPVLGTFGAIGDLVRDEPGAMGAYVVSMTHDLSDLLEVLLLAKEAGLWRYDDERVEAAFDLVPLFETIEDLDGAARLLDTFFRHPLYRLHLAARGGFQEIMLGYSDSNKDGGYWMANWALHQGQATIGAVCRRHGVDFRLFHGRGGTVGRGGGRANQAIQAMPPVVHNGRIRFTEQGEVISFRYALPGIGHRHLEQIVSAVLLSTAGAEQAAEAGQAAADPAGAPLEGIARTAMTAYRALIDDPGFWPWYTRATPIEHISRLPIASRPVSRGGGAVDFEGLRAIPWVFAWTQTRYNVPGWYGTGQALQAAFADDPSLADTLAGLNRAWPFFQAVVNNAQRELARARLPIARRYATLAGEASFHEHIAADYAAARDALLRITGQQALLDVSPVIQRSIALRNPYTDVLNLVQIELLRRYRAEADAARQGAYRQALFLSINGIAAAMQSTG